MSFADRVMRFLGGRAADERRVSVDQEIESVKATIRQNTQALQSGTRVIQNMSGAMRLLSESKREELN